MRAQSVAVAIATLICHPAQAEDKILGMIKGRLADAVITSRIAERLCPDLRMNKQVALMALQYHGFSGLDDMPEGRTRAIMEGFARDKDAACRFARAQYGSGSDSLGLNFLYPVSPFGGR